MPELDPCAAAREALDAATAEKDDAARRLAAGAPDAESLRILEQEWGEADSNYLAALGAYNACMTEHASDSRQEPQTPQQPGVDVMEIPREDATFVPTAPPPMEPAAVEDATAVPEFTPTSPAPSEGPGQPAASGWTPGAYEFHPANPNEVSPGYADPSTGYVHWHSKPTRPLRKGLVLGGAVAVTLTVATVAGIGIVRGGSPAGDSPAGSSTTTQAAGPLTATGNFIAEGNACNGPLTLRADWTFGGAKPGDKVVIALTGDSVPSSATATVGSDVSVHLSYPIPPAKANTQVTYTGTVQSVGGRKPADGYGWSKNAIVRCTVLGS